MKKDLIILCFAGLLVSHGILSEARDSKTDSLLRVVQNSNADTNKLFALIELSKLLEEDDPEKSYKYSYQAVELGRAINDHSGLILALYNYSILLRSNGYLDSSLTYTAQYMSLAKETGDLKWIGSGYQQYGNIHRRQGNTDTAYRCYLKSMEIFNEIRDTINLIGCYNSLGTVHRILTAYDSASYYYLKAVELSEKYDYEMGMMAPLINLGKVSTMLKDYEKSKTYSLWSLELTSKDSNIRLMAIAYANLGVNEYEQGNYDAAGDYYNIALKMNLRIQNLMGINNMYNNLGNVYKSTGHPEKALQNYNKAYCTFKKIDYMSGMTSALMNRASIHADMGQYETAHALYDSCLILTDRSGDLGKREEIYLKIYSTYQQAGNYRKAFEFMNQYLLIHDSIYRLEKEKLITDYTMKYDKQKDQARILSLENDNLLKENRIRKRTNQRNIYLFGGSASLMVMIFLFVFYRHKTRKDRIIAQQKILQLEEEKKLLAAKSIVDGQENERKRIAKELHDGLGVLLSAAKMQFTILKDKSPENKPLIDKAAKLLEQAAGDVRKISHNMMPGLLTRLGFFEAVGDLLERLDETENLKATCEVTGDPGRMPENTEIMLYRIVQELVNNSLKHASAKSILLALDAGEDSLSLYYRDDGRGFVLDEKRESNSMGLSSIVSRVNFLNGTMSIDTAPGAGTTYKLKIPVVFIKEAI